MLVSDFDYELPAELIAQEPAAQRTDSRLLVLDRETGAVRHRQIRQLPELLEPGDLLVLNDARVFPARLEGRKATGGRVEVLLATRRDEGGPRASEQEWEVLLGGSRPPRAGGRVSFAPGFSAELLEEAEGDRPARVLLRSRGPVDEAVDRWGRIPLPPYIRRAPGDPRDAMDRERYQTVFAARRGAAAAPTAGLHFTASLLDSLRNRGIETAFLTLEVSLGTFRPVSADRVEDHRLHPERFRIGEAIAGAVLAARERGGRVVAVGTTVVRALEQAAAGGRIRAGRGWCDLFIVPGYRFHVVDALLTNFHLPRSTLLMLVSALAGRVPVLAAYAEAVRQRYRFYSYGDAMLVLPARGAHCPGDPS
jgi:S-adenosylmethionine:tRNA ribosyltransferase-isomerase